MSRQEVRIRTPDGEAPAYVFTPDQGAGPWPAVLFYTDAAGIRPAVFEMGERLAAAGYYVLTPDMFWRAGAYGPIVPRELFADPEARQAHFTSVVSSTNPQRAMSDTGAFLDWLAKQPQARADKVGVTGYCMGGMLAVRAAETFPDRVAAAGAFHPGGLVADGPDSPHLQVGKIRGKVLVAGADQDSFFTDEQCATLQKAVADAGVDVEVSIWRGALHGFAPPDMPVYDREHSERHWRELLQLFGEQLNQPQAA